MTKERMLALTDGVFAVVITIMVLDLKIPHEASLDALRPVWVTLLSYLLSFIYIGIYWNNHHHMFQLADQVNGAILWANLHLLFWLSLVPFVTGWLGETHFAGPPDAAYGFVMLMAAIAYFVLQNLIVKLQGPDSELKRAIGKDVKGKLSPLILLVGICVSCWLPWLAVTCYAAVAAMWIIPDRRIESRVVGS